MKSRHLILLMFVLGGVGLISLVVVDAAFRARANALTAFQNYNPIWDEALREPVEHRAVEVLGRLLSAPQDDPELAMAALSVIRLSSSWSSMVPQIHSQLRVVLDAQLQSDPVLITTVRPIYDLLSASDFPDLISYHNRIQALAGERAALVVELQESVAALNSSQEEKAEDALDRLDAAWLELRGPINGQELNWLAQQKPEISEIEFQAEVALVRYVRRLLEPFGIPLETSYGQAIPDPAMIKLIEQRAHMLSESKPDARKRVRRAAAILRRHSPNYVHEPVIMIAIVIASRHHQLPLAGLLIGLGILMSLFLGIIYAMIGLRRGPTPVDVNAETMENVSPIDLDTDAETRSRSSASITDVG